MALFLCVLNYWSHATRRTLHAKSGLFTAVRYLKRCGSHAHVGYKAARATCDVRRAATLFLLLLSSVLIACQPTPQAHKYAGAVMGTTYHVTVIAAEVPADLGEQIQQSLDRIDQLMSTYKADSELSRFNRAAVGEEQLISTELAEVVAISQRVYQLTDAAFDPTVGPLVDLWGFGPADTGDQLPTPEAIAEALAEIGFDALQLNGNRLLRSRSVMLDLSAVAKGYAADQVSELLTAQGLSDHLVEVGGEMRLSGTKPNNQSWMIGIEKPELGRSGAQLAVALTDVGLATSGDYRNYFERDGVRYSHTLDPRTGRPVTHKLASVTVIAENSALADALATGFLVLGDKRTLQIAEAEDIPVYLLVKEGDEIVARHSSVFAPYLN